MPVPVLDLESLDGPTLVRELQANSCVFLTGLGPLLDALTDMVAASQSFFAEPESVKARVQWGGEGPWQGWQPVYSGGSGAAPMERFEVALPDPSCFPDTVTWTDTFAQWPDDRFAGTWGEYYLHMRALTNRLSTMIARTLDLPMADMQAWTDRQHSNLCVNHYLPQTQPPPDGQERSAPHTDMGGLTLLWGQNRPGGLHVLVADGTWVPVEFPDGAILVQAGDLLHLWSGGSIPANMHRVVNPELLPAPERYSVVFFHHPDLESWVAPVGGSGTNAGDHVMARQRASYQL